MMNDRITDAERALVEKRAAEIREREGGRLQRLISNDLAAVLKNVSDRDLSFQLLQEIADDVGELVAPSVPCRRGCSHCCNIAVTISRPEAVQIARAARREMTEVTDSGTTRADYNKRYMGVPCPFLKDNACSVYKVRPLACRTHHSLASSAEPCDVSTGSKPVPWLDLSPFVMVSAAVMRGQPYGDIREFFPEPDHA